MWINVYNLLPRGVTLVWKVWVGLPIQKENEAPLGPEARGEWEGSTPSSSDSGVWESIMSSPSEVRGKYWPKTGFIYFKLRRSPLLIAGKSWFSSDVNKDLTFKAKDQTLKDKDQTPKDKDNLQGQGQGLGQLWGIVPTGLFLPVQNASLR